MCITNHSFRAVLAATMHVMDPYEVRTGASTLFKVSTSLLHRSKSTSEEELIVRPWSMADVSRAFSPPRMVYIYTPNEVRSHQGRLDTVSVSALS